MASNIVLPEFGQDWITGCEGKYIILSTKYSDKHITMYWAPKQLGYSDSLAGAGLYTEDEIKRLFASQFIQAVPIPCTRDAFATLGLYPVIADYEQLEHFKPIRISQRQGR